MYSPRDRKVFETQHPASHAIEIADGMIETHGVHAALVWFNKHKLLAARESSRCPMRSSRPAFEREQ